MSAKRLNYKHVDYELDLNFAFINVFFKKKNSPCKDQESQTTHITNHYKIIHLLKYVWA